MATTRSTIRRARSVLRLVLALALPAALAQPLVAGSVPQGADLGGADVVAEARLALAWFPVEVGRGSVDADGAFVLRFHQPLPLAAEISMPVARLFADQRCDDLIVSDPAARVVMVRDLRMIPDGAPCEFCDTLAWLSLGTRPRGAHPAGGDLEVQWLYADRPLSVDGVCQYGWGSETYALELHPGWNVLLLETVVVHPSDGYCDCRDVVVSTVPGYPDAGLAWHLLPGR